MTQLATLDGIERKIDRQLAGGVSVNPKKGLVVESLGQAMELAKLMAVSNTAVPKHLRGDPGACLAIAIQGYEWSINPFALANKSYVVNDRLAYESALYHAVVQRRAPIKGRIKHEYAGDGQNRTCRVWALLDDESEDTVEYVSPKTGTIKPKNSPLWMNDPDQQLFYFSVRAFARRHFPDVMMGIYTVDELMDVPTDMIQPAPTKADNLADKVAAQKRLPSEGQRIEMDTGEVLDGNVGEPAAPEQPAPESAPETPEIDTSGVDAEPELPSSPPVQTTGTLASWWEQLNELARAAGVQPDQLSRGVGKWAVAERVKGKENMASFESQKVLFDAIRNRQGAFA